ncbi:DUF1622 domain-containing protein [Chloroflexota bacterium]
MDGLFFTLLLQVLDIVSFSIGAIAMLVLVWGVLLGLIAITRYETHRLRSSASEISLNEIRHNIGAYLLLGLEFLIAADIIRTIVRPTLEELGILGGIVVIRTIISYFLAKEVGEKEAKRGYPASPV